MTSTEMPGPSGGGVSVLRLAVGIGPLVPFALELYRGATGGQGYGGAISLVTIYSVVGLAIHILHLLCRVVSKQWKLPLIKDYMLGEVVATGYWVTAIGLVATGHQLGALAAYVLAIVLILISKQGITECLRYYRALSIAEWVLSLSCFGKTLEERLAFVEAASPSLGSPFRRFSKTSAGLAAILGALALNVTMTFAATAGELTQRLTHGTNATTSVASTTTTAPNTTVPSTTTTPTTRHRGTTTTIAKNIPAPTPGFADVCGDKAIVPGASAPAWAEDELWNLYFAKPDGLGAAVAGCPERTLVVKDNYDEVAYQVGRLEGVVVGVSVVSRGGRRATFLGAAADHVKTLLDAGVAVSGTPRVNFGGGDLYLLSSREGTTLIARRGKDISTTDGAYMILPPSMTEAWRTEVEAFGEWLWPVAADDDTESLHHVHLVPASSTTSIAELRWPESIDPPLVPTYVTLADLGITP